MGFTRKFAIVLGIALASAAAPSQPTSAFPNPESGLAAPFSPSGTIYRPECRAVVEASSVCGGGDW
jgi:hypothetical protein